MPSLSSRLDHDVYQVVRRLEESSNDCKPFKTVSAAYNAIKTSNSSLSRQKKRPLEDALFRVLDVRKREQAQDSDDSEAEIDVDFDTPETKGDERFLLNRQITKHWKVEPATMPQATSNGEQPAKKKRRVETEDDGNTVRATSEGPKEPKEGKTADGSKLQKKTPRSPLFDVETGIELRLGGLGATYEAILTKTRHALFADEHYEDPTKIGRHIHGLALTGPSFVGKKSYIQAIASQLNVPLINITRCFQEQERLEKSLTEAFDTAVAAAPCIVYIKHIEQIMPKSGEASQNEQHQKAFGAFQRQMERLAAQRTPVMCMVTATRQEDAYPALFGPDMIEKDYQLRVPNVEERRDILSRILHNNTVHDEVNLLDIARKMDGCVGGDIVMLAEGATTNAGLRLAAAKGVDLDHSSSSDDRDADTEGTTSLLQPNPITLEDFTVALADYTPTLRKEGFTAIPNVTWDQVGGLASVRAQLRLSIVGPITQPELYARFGLARAGGCLLWGPPGCGKTLIAQAVANEAQASFILINGPELLNKYVGESERAVRELFTRARSSTPCILFFDEFDSIAARRDSAGAQSGGGAGTRVVNALLTELDGARGRDGIYVIGTTNRPDMIDEAILRPGRLSKQLFLDLPTEAERVEILRTIYRNRHVGASDDELARLDDVARDARCANFSGADLSGLHERAAEVALTRFLDNGHLEATGEIRTQDWEDALKVTKPSVAKPESFRKLMRAKQ